ncbi:TetR/AcrR family transcriptional regulator [Phytomonospora endophytica]|uniref:AcrR family transcriptional regulator n=1 Tax=Phytomonospora endophytica TaxID=714109 RepID=A0A841FNP8_9ACTN|nr:TetR/AcrR family transcriptional regulator [Phytomonospora endophytica]MBB6034847.1 AcrR family transcriptional regulator [Phytomonospora endophytica]GIG68949.1 transcriptional regulator [Phytomonospora endophytica]
MPRVVDHESRRRRIAAAVFGLIAEGGLEAATLREAADRAGVSMGAVQRCFATKEQLMLFVHDYLNAQVTARVQTRIDAAPDPGDTVTMLAETLAGILPLDEDSRAESRVWLAFAAQAAVDPALGELQRRSYRELAALFALLVRAAAESGRFRAGLDPDVVAADLVTMTDGLSVQLLVGLHTPDSARVVLDARLDALRA